MARRAPARVAVSRAVVPFRVDVPQEQLDDLADRLRRTRFPEPATADGWTQGVPLNYLRDVCRTWAETYDWRATERRLNAWPQVRTEIDGLRIHALHVRSPHPGAFPLVLTHGWPGSVAELFDVIDPLTDPPAHGGDAADAFHLVVPSLPGYGFSDRPTEPGWGVGRIAAAWAELMARLGHHHYGAQGTDWGTSVSAALGRLDPEHVAGVHLMPPLVAPDPATFGDLTDAERTALESLRLGEEDSGYARVHATRPQTVGYSLVDSPAGLAAWVLEKPWAWTDGDGHPENVVARDRLLDLVMLYWLPGTGASSARLYAESIDEVHRALTVPGADPVHVPAGGTVYPRENQRPSRRWAERRLTDLRYWSEPARGGHFPALEQPESFVAELRAFFRLVR
ncbi:epoxide hydrolase family protein [Cellulomonas cellasea]|uniref:epoxide hydrolase family protein n=1 Tax=Cellulomonas cellasea TaxID=43670 RepID=UPI001FEAAEFD|nr:epoxide hydrolase family protein [Cellulomonas cellasea]